MEIPALPIAAALVLLVLVVGAPLGYWLHGRKEDAEINAIVQRLKSQEREKE